MTQEEKARAYDKALNIAREILDHTSENYLCTHLTKEDIKDMYIRFFFPELKESEDERIRKGLIKAVSRIFEGNKLFDTDVTREEALAWLEKVITPNHNDIDSSFIEDIKNVINEAPLLMQSDKEKMIAWLEKQGESYTKRDVDDAWLKGMCDAKRELEKQGEQDMIPLNKVIKFLDEQLVNDKDEVTGEPFINFQNYGAYKETFIAYFKRKMLEKQGEQKPIIEMKSPEESLGISSKEYNEIVNECLFGKSKSAEKVEPKFHEGEWIVFNGLTLYIKEVVKGFYRTISKDGIPNSYDWDIDNLARLWTIQDAKKGDVLACENGWTCIFKCLNDNLFSSHCFMDHEGWFCEDGGQAHTLDNRICGEIYPATKEQRDLLFEKMKEAGYEWNAEKKELKKVEQKPSWSEEDERNLNDAILFIETGTYSLDKDNLINWLKSLRPQNTWKPSDMQMKALHDLNITGGISYIGQGQELINLYNDLKKLTE